MTKSQYFKAQTQKLSCLGLFLFTFSTSAMVGGKAVAPNNPLLAQVAQIATWVDAKALNENSRRLVANCTATFVAEDLLLTAGHCIARPEGMKLELSFELKPNQVIGGIGRTLESDFTILDSRIPANGDDLALVKIDRKLSGRGLPLLRLTPSLEAKILSYGFGEKARTKLTSVRLSLPSLSPRFFESSLNQVLSEGQFRQVSRPNDTFTVLKKLGSGGHCYGDSGGPNLINIGSGWAIVGVTTEVLPLKDLTVCTNKSAIVNVRAQSIWLDHAAHELGGKIRWVN